MNRVQINKKTTKYYQQPTENILKTSFFMMLTKSTLSTLSNRFNDVDTDSHMSSWFIPYQKTIYNHHS